MAVSFRSRCTCGILCWFLLIQGCLPSQQTRQSPMFAMSDVTNDLGVCALQLLATSMPGRNIAFSPYGLASVSMLLYEGSSGNTALQLRHALQLPYDAVYARVGFRDLYRHLRTYFMSDGFLKGLLLSRENICIRSDYMKVLAFYGFDLPEHTSVEPCNGTSSSTRIPSSTSSTSTVQSSTNPSSTNSVQSSTSNSTTTERTSGSYTASLGLTSTTPTVENKETPAPGSTESIMETTPLMTTVNPTTNPTVTTLNPDISQSITTLNPDISQIITTLNPDTSQSITTLNPDISQSITTLNPDTSQSITTLNPDISQIITTLNPDTSQSITTLSPDISQIITTLNPDTSQSITTLNPDTSQSITSQGTEPTILEQLTSITTQSSGITQPMDNGIPPGTTVSLMETTMSMMNLEMTTKFNAESLVTTVPTDEVPTDPPVTVSPELSLNLSVTSTRPSQTTISDRLTTSTNGPLGEVTTLSNKIGVGESSVVTTNNVDAATTMGNVDATTVGIIDATTVATNVGTTENNVVFTSPPEVPDENTTPIVNVNSETTTPAVNINSETTISVVNVNSVETTPAENAEVTAININEEVPTNNPIVATEEIETTSRPAVETPTISNGGSSEDISAVNSGDISSVNTGDINAVSNGGITVMTNMGTVTTGPFMTTLNVEQSTNSNVDEAVQTTPANKNDKLSTIVEVTELPPSTINPQVMDGQGIDIVGTARPEKPSESNTMPGNSDDRPTTTTTILDGTTTTIILDGTTTTTILDGTTTTTILDGTTTIVEENPPTTTTSTLNAVNIATTTENAAIVFNTTPRNKNDKLSTIVEVTAPPPSTVNVNDFGATDIPVIPEINTTEFIDTSNPSQTTNPPQAPVEIIDNLQTLDQRQPGSQNDNPIDINAPVVIQNDPIVGHNEQTVTQNEPTLTTITSLITETSDTNTNTDPSLETLQPLSSVNTLVANNNTLVETNETLLDGHNPNVQAQIINNILIEDSLAEMLPLEQAYLDKTKPDKQAYLDKPKPNKASIVLNYDYLNPDNFQEYVNIVDRNDKNVNGFNDSEPDFTDALIQDDTRRNNSKSLGHHFMDNNQVRYTYESFLNDYAEHLSVRNARSIDYESPLLHKIKSWIKFKSGYSHLDPLPLSPVTPSFDPPLTGFVPSFAGKSGDYSGGRYSGGGYGSSSGGFSHAGSFSSAAGTGHESSGSFSGGHSPSSGYQSYLPSGTYQSVGGSTYGSGGSTYASNPGGSSYYSGQGRPSVTPSYEPPYASYLNRVPDHLDWFLANGRARVVPVMRYSAVLPYAYITPLDAFALEVPLDDEKYKLLVLLPSSSYGLSALLKALPYCSIRAIYSQLRYVPVYATLPVFDVVEQISLTPALQQMGVTDIFYLSKADLSTMSSDSNLFVRDIMQVVAIYAKKYNSDQVHEVPTRSTQTTFTASHSFVYFVVDNFTKVTLLAGIVEDPTTKH